MTLCVLLCGQGIVFGFAFYCWTLNVKHRQNWCVIMILASFFLVLKPIVQFSMPNLPWVKHNGVQPKRCTSVSFAFSRRTREQDANLLPAKSMALWWVEPQIAITDPVSFLHQPERQHVHCVELYVQRNARVRDFPLECQPRDGHTFYSQFGIKFKILALKSLT